MHSKILGGLAPQLPGSYAYAAHASDVITLCLNDRQLSLVFKP